MKTFIAIALLLFGTCFWMSCSFNSSSSPDSTQLIKTSIGGLVLDEAGNAVENAMVTVHGKSVSTNSRGLFLLSDVDVPSDRCVIQVIKSGYFHSYRAIEPKANATTQVRLGMMQSNVITTFDATKGGVVNLTGGASISFNANSFISATGAAYSGKVHLAAKLLSPSSPRFYEFFSGDFAAQSVDQSRTTLRSFGVMRIELSDDAGKQINLAASSKAVLTIPIPAGLTADATVPLWYFDEITALWKEEGISTKVGSNLVGEVHHFSDWNFDAKGDAGSLHIRVRCSNEYVSDVVMHVGQGTVVTDDKQTDIRRVPTGVPITISIRSEENGGLTIADKLLPALAPGESRDVDIELSVCPAYITGTLMGCDNNPLNGTIYGEYSSGEYFFGFSRNGAFRTRVRSGEDFTLLGIAPDGRESDKIVVAKLASSEIRSVGTLTACTGTSYAFRDLDLQTKGLNAYEQRPGLQISSDGTFIVSHSSGVISIWDATTHQLKKTIPVAGSVVDSLYAFSNIGLSRDDKTLLVPVSNSTWACYDLQSGTLISNYAANTGARISPDGKVVLLINSVYDATTQTYSSRLDFVQSGNGSLIRSFTNIGGKPLGYLSNYCEFLNDNQFAIILQEVKGVIDPRVYIVNITDGSIAKSFDVGGGFVTTSSLDGSVIVVNSFKTNYGGSSFYSVNTGTLLSSIALTRTYTQLLPAIHPNNLVYATQKSFDRDSSLFCGTYAVTSGLLLKPLVSPSYPSVISRLLYCANGKSLIGLYLDGTAWKVRVWTL